MGVSGRGSEVVPSFPAPPSMRFLRLALLPLVLLAPVADAQVEIDLEAGTLTVLGTATVTAPPDQAVVRLGVETRAATPAEALRQHEEDVARVLAEVRGLSAETVAEVQVLIAAAQDTGSKQTLESGDFERARNTQQAAVRALREHAALTAKDAAAALKDHPQLRERLGLTERS